MKAIRNARMGNLLHGCRGGAASTAPLGPRIELKVGTRLVHARLGMRGLRLVSAVLGLAALLAAAPAAADKATDAFHAAVADAYRQYREAMHYHETGNAELGDMALEQFVADWKALTARYAGRPPPAYAKDAAFAETLAAIEAKAASALGSAPAEALLALKPIRSELAALRKRNGQRVFSDCIDVMNAAMDRLWEYRQKPPDANQLSAFQAATRDTAARYRECREEAPPALRESVEFSRMMDGALASFARLEAATDAELIVSLLRELRSFDKLIWLRFG